MKRLVFILFVILAPSAACAQYWGERTTDQSFETSPLHFRSHFLNPYGMHRFDDVVVGLIDDPFLNLHLNPAQIPDFKGGLGQFYFDFRGDRTEPAVISSYYSPVYGDAYFRPDPRAYRQTRVEPEPVFSLGLLAYPFRESLRKLFVGGTYQIIYKEEPYYASLFPIYLYREGYAPDGERIFDPDADIPIQDRYFGKDELSTEAHLYSVFAGLPLSKQWTAGIGINGVTHSRDGGYINRYADEYGNTNDWDSRSHSERERNQDYTHVDLSAGLLYTLSRHTTLGIKLGHLSGEADQDELRVDSSFYARGDSLRDSKWSFGRYRSTTTKTWNRDGDSWYARAHFDHEVSRGQRIRGYYRYGASRADLTSAATIFDTSSHASHYVGINWTSNSRSSAATSDVRTATGEWQDVTHQAMIGMDWKLTRRSHVNLGATILHSRTDIGTAEPVSADRFSDTHYRRTGANPWGYDNYYRLIEEKTLNWTTRTTYWTIQIPVILRHRAGERFHLSLGVNRILEHWDIAEETIAYFVRRLRTDNGVTKEETNFAERYTQPDKKITDDYTAVFGSVEMAVSPQFRVRLMVEPQTEDGFRINQWWLSFTVQL